MKKVFSILLCTLFSLSLSASTEKNANGADGSDSYNTEKSVDPEMELSIKKEAGTETNEESDAEPDSSYYSVNKFNFLFYFVYKMKYMDESEEDSSEE